MSWSRFVSQDMEHHIEIMRNKMHIFRGKMSRRTLLPIPTIAGKIELDQKISETSYVMIYAMYLYRKPELLFIDAHLYPYKFMWICHMCDLFSFFFAFLKNILYFYSFYFKLY